MDSTSICARTRCDVPKAAGEPFCDRHAAEYADRTAGAEKHAPLKRFPWLDRRDAELLSAWYELDPQAAREYERHLDNERYSDEQFYRHNVSLDALREGGAEVSDDGDLVSTDELDFWWQTAQAGVYPD